MTSDAELVQQTLAGRTEAYGELVRRWAGRITALCHARIGCGHTADDLAQETLLRAYRALPSLSNPEKFGAWVSSIALRTCLNWRKAKERSQIPFSVLGPGNTAEDLFSKSSLEEPSLDRDEEWQRLRAEVAALPPEYREVILLYYHEDVTYQDLAQLLGVSRATINARLTKARVMLREALSHCRS
jgi:RNA polymerase sigma-70 factor (ECF subfamily)